MGRGPKLTKLQREAHLARVAELYNACVPQHEIGRRLGVTRQQVSYDLKQLVAAWQKVANDNIEEQRARELAKINHLEETYWRAWEKSEQPLEKTATKTKRKGVAQGGSFAAQDDEAAISKTVRDGNPLFLQGVERCIEMRRKLLGTDLTQAGAAVQVLVVGVNADAI